MEEIQFRLLSDLNELVTTWCSPTKFVNEQGTKWEVPAHKPYLLCAVSPSILLYADRSVTPSVIRQLDVSTLPPRPLTPICEDKAIVSQFGSTSAARIVRPRNAQVYDMCHVQRGDKELVIAIDCDERYENGVVTAFDLATGDSVWSVEGQFPGMEYDLDAVGVTTDLRGHVFLSDWNNHCVQVFSPEGTYLGPVMRRERPRCERIHWNEATSSLVAQCNKNDLYDIRVLKVIGC